MPEYSCECCQFKTHIKPHFERHNGTTKHLAMANKVQTEPAKNDYTEIIEDLYKNIAELKEQFINQLAELKAENVAMKTALEECKQQLTNNFKQSFTQVVQPQAPTQPQQIIITQQAPAPVPEKEPDETCNPRYIEKRLNDDPAMCKDINKYFSYKSDDVKFEFDDINDVYEITKKYVVDRIVKHVKENLKNNVEMPFKYIKSSWYIKTADEGWKKEETLFNKGKQPGDPEYEHSIIVKKWLYSFKINVINYYDTMSGSSRWRGPDSNWDEMAYEVFQNERYSNSDILSRLKELY